MQIDTTEIDRLAADLGVVGALAGPFINSAVQHTSKNISTAAQKKVSKRKLFNVAAGAIDYEIKATPGVQKSRIESEIGYDKDKPAGALGNLLEFGAPNAKAHMLVKRDGKWIAVPVPGDRARPVTPGNELATSMKENEADFEHGLSEALKDAEKKAGL